MSTTPSDYDDARVKAQILGRYPNEPSNISLSPILGRSLGKVNDEAVEFCYRSERRDYRHTGALFDCLSWENLESEHLDELVTIGVKYIVGVHTIGGRASDSYSLIFVEPLARGEDTHTPTLGLRTVTIVNPPEDLLSDFLCPEEPEHLFVEASSSTPNLHVVVSNTDLASDVWCNLLRQLLEHFSLLQETDYTLHHITGEDTIADLVTSSLLPRAVQGIAQTIILLSGDGSVTDLLNALLSTSPHVSEETQSTNPSLTPIGINLNYVKPTLALLPCGTGNALAHSNFITSNRITKHSTLGLRTLLMGTPIPLPYFRTAFSPGARLSTKSQGRVPLRCLPQSNGSEELADGEGEATPTFYGAVVASWALHATLVANSVTHRDYGSKGFEMAAEEALCLRSNGDMPHAYEGKVTLLDTAQISSNGCITSCGDPVERKELMRREHAYVLATCCAFLEEGFEISPEHNYGSGGLRVVEFGPLVAPVREGRESGVADAAGVRPGDEIMRIIQAAFDGGKHVEELQVGYHDIGGIRIDVDDAEENEEWRRFCIDGKIIVVERGGWMEVRALDEHSEGVLDLIVMEWETSECSFLEGERF